MKLNRRSLLKILGGAAAAAVVAPALPAAASGPLFIPAERLDFGVPKQLLTATSLAEAAPLAAEQAFVIDHMRSTATMRGTVPMTLLQDEYVSEWGGRLKAGSTVMVDGETASRWIAGSIAVAAPSAPSHLREWSTSVQGERQRERDEDARRLSWHNNADTVAATFSEPQWLDFGERMQETERQRLSSEDAIGRMLRSADQRVVTWDDIFDLDDDGMPIKKATI